MPSRLEIAALNSIPIIAQQLTRIADAVERIDAVMELDREDAGRQPLPRPGDANVEDQRADA